MTAGMTRDELRRLEVMVEMGALCSADVEQWFDADQFSRTSIITHRERRAPGLSVTDPAEYGRLWRRLHAERVREYDKQRPARDPEGYRRRKAAAHKRWAEKNRAHLAATARRRRAMKAAKVEP